MKHAQPTWVYAAQGAPVIEPPTPRQPSRDLGATATLTRCGQGQPLVVLESSPFNGLEIRPGDLRALAQRLSALAEMATKLPTGGKHFRPTKVQLGTAE